MIAHIPYHEKSFCRICRLGLLDQIMDLGQQPPANFLVNNNQSEQILGVPLTLCICSECGIVQLRETIEPSVLFNRYTWVTGTGLATRAFSLEFESLVRSTLGGYNNVLEFASNDGTFLKPFQERASIALGVEPAVNIAEIAKANECETIIGFYNKELAHQISDTYAESFDLIFGRNVVAHADKLEEIAEAVDTNLSSAGCLIVEVHDGLKVLEETQYDSVYHEHIYYHTLASLTRAFDCVGLRPFHVLEGPLSGGSLIVFLDRGHQPTRESVELRQSTESSARLDKKESWVEFAFRANSHAATLTNIIEGYEGDVYAFGQSARGTVLLHNSRLNSEKIVAVIDNAPLKQGKKIPALDLKIVSLDSVAQHLVDADAILLLAWNFEDEIVNQLRETGFRGDVVVPFPRLVVKRVE